MLKIILWDLDHTICDSKWRDDLMSSGWDIYHSELEKDKVFPHMVELVNDLAKIGYTNIAFTMRPEKWRQPTITHLLRNNVALSLVLMRAQNDWSPADVTKVSIVREFFKTPEQLAALKFIVDDRDDVCAMFTQEFGISTFQVRHGNGY